MTLTIHTFVGQRPQFIAEKARMQLMECGFREEIKIEGLSHGLPESGGFSVLRDAIARGGRDAAVCSVSELPFGLPAGLRVVHSPRRLTRTDCLLSKGSYTRLPSGATVCCSGSLRKAQLLRARGDLDVEDAGGTAESLIRAVEDGRYSAAAFAACDAEAMGYGGNEWLKLHELPLTHFVPKAGQGVNVLIFPEGLLPESVVKRADNLQSKSEVFIERTTERSMASQTGAPLGISCSSFGSGFTLRLQLLSEDGTYERRLSRSIGRSVPLPDVISDFLEGVPSFLLRQQHMTY